MLFINELTASLHITESDLCRQRVEKAHVLIQSLSEAIEVGQKSFQTRRKPLDFMRGFVGLTSLELMGNDFKAEFRNGDPEEVLKVVDALLAMGIGSAEFVAWDFDDDKSHSAPDFVEFDEMNRTEWFDLEKVAHAVRNSGN